MRCTDSNTLYKMKFRTIITLLFVSFLYPIVAQVDDASCMAPDKKVIKLIEKAKLSTDARSAVDAFLEAINLAPDNAMVYYEYGLFAFNKASEYYNLQPTPNTNAGDKSLQKAEEMFMETIELCSKFHADAYYYLGVINYTQQDMEASREWFTKFSNFKSDDPSRFSADHEKNGRCQRGSR